MEKKTGWQQPSVPVSGEESCTHFGVIFAKLGLMNHPEGHEWVCSCGKTLIVVSNGGQNKRLVPKDSQ